MKQDPRIYEPQLSVRKRILYWTILFLLVITISFLIPEIALRFYYREEEVNGNYWGIGAFEYLDPVGYHHAPGYKGFAIRPDVFILPVQINRLGLRQSNLEEQMQYPARLLILGDSFVFGLGVGEESTFTLLIQTDLNPEGVGIINGGQTGYSVEQEMGFGISLVPDVRPDIIILSLFPENDIRGDYRKGYNNIDVKYGYRLPKDRLFPMPVIDYFRTRSYLWLFLEGRINRMEFMNWRREFGKFARSSPDQAVQPTLDALRELRDFCENNNIRFGVMIIPPERGSSIFDDTMRMALNDYDIDVLDLGNKDFNEQDYIQGDGHWNEAGHQKAAQYLTPFVRQLLNE